MAIYPQGSLSFHRPGRQDIARTYPPPPPSSLRFLLFWRKIIGLGLSIHICREAVPIEKKHAHLGFYKHVWPSLPLEPLRCGFKRNFIVQNSSWLKACRKSRGKREKPEFGNLGDKMDTVQFNPLQESSATSTNQYKMLKTNSQLVTHFQLSFYHTDMTFLTQNQLC